MKFHIFTVYNSRNFGSYLQATALLRALSKYGQVDFVDTQSRSIEAFKGKEMMKNIFHLQFKRAIFEYRCSKDFLEKQKMLPVAQIEDVQPEDICVFGSDEIWNVARKAFSNYPIFWGNGFEENPKFSYAPSINYATEQQLREYGAKDYLSRFIAVSARDDYSKETLGNVCNTNIEKVIDPTMLFTKEQYLSKYRRDKVPYKNYIAVYSYFRKNDEQVAQIKKLARKLGKKLVSVGLYNSWCDYCVTSPDLNPFVYYEDADLVISNTFHGVAFAITFQKQFIAVLDKKSNKVQSMLDDFGLNDRISDGASVEQMNQIVNKPIDYAFVNAVLEERRKKSFEFIESSINASHAWKEN